jgi:hypothetical protein
MLNNMIVFEDKSLDPAKLGGIQSHNGVGSEYYTLDIINKLLVGKTIRVYWSEQGNTLSSDNGWITSMCIKGKLENKSNKCFRVLVNDDTYTYFGFSDILTVCVRKDRPNSISLKSKSNN